MMRWIRSSNSIASRRSFWLITLLKSYVDTLVAYKDRPPRYEQRSRYVVHVKRELDSITAARLDMGWRLYATNAPTSKLTLEKAVFAYRESPLIERNFARLKGKSLGIRPLYVQLEDHVLYHL